ncbi:hypothetical protein GPECTOR_173g206 [Gonium pectorale]|uniref:Tyr recombinase domain-containing protein n=1 Tax=Gonium pectorale TaxID=33097 RepID=A0A150FYY0_GONPE|nr:hypothetical protein GPECTOR_173g206 [Gonium pectorale]|eukprot:KXZ42260.1 hypothetical protein GPECTOR_173g206 [Gonium pectorale]
MLGPPARRFRYLGMIIDTERGTFVVPEDKRERVLTAIRNALSAHRITARALASVKGQLLSMSWAFGPWSRLRTRGLGQLIETRRSWSTHLALSKYARADLRFWLAYFDHFNGTRALWTPTQSFDGPAGLGGHAVKVITDNLNAANIINKGAAKADACYEVAVELLWYCVERDIRLQAEWRPRTMNQLADYWSKVAEPDAWSLLGSAFRRLNRLWGPFDIDLFASHRNHHLPTYYSAYFTPDTAGVDAFRFRWDAKLRVSAVLGPSAAMADATLRSLAARFSQESDKALAASTLNQYAAPWRAFVAWWRLRRLPGSKTDQLWDGAWVVVGRLGGPVYPVGLVERLLRQGAYRRSPSHPREDVGPLLRVVQHTRDGGRLQRLVGTLEHPVYSTSYTAFSEALAAMCVEAGIAAHTTPHSMRIGGNSTAAANGVPAEVRRAHGRWLSPSMVDLYTRRSPGAGIDLTRRMAER